MSDLIKREDAIKVTWQEPTYTDPLNVLTEVRDGIEAIPSVDRPQGKWIDSQGRPMRLYESFSANCSACGEWSEYLTEYCPHCGAKMDGGEK